MSIDKRIAALEARLQNIENVVRHLASTRSANSVQQADHARADAALLDAPPRRVPQSRPAPSNAQPLQPDDASYTGLVYTQVPTAPLQSQAASPSGIARVLGVGGVFALLLAASYLVRLALESGWLTPGRQCALAAALGIAMIAAGLALDRHDRQYASLLPAAGLTILYLTVFGAHLLYGLVDVAPAAVMVALLSAAALALGHHLRTNIYALLSAISAYSVPLLLPLMRDDVTGLAIYFCAWSVVYTSYAVIVRNRSVYIIAMYLGLALFAYLPAVSPAWTLALIFQTLQLLIFGWGAVQFSVRTGKGMTSEEAAVHAPALLFFYAVQYGTLNQNVPALAPMIALASAAALVALYMVAHTRLSSQTVAGAQLVSGYVALVLFHAVYVELLSPQLRAAVALVAAPAMLMLVTRRVDIVRYIWPVVAAVGGMYLLSYWYLASFFMRGNDAGVLDTLLIILFAAQLYAGYRFVRGLAVREAGTATLYGGHIMAVNACWLIIHNTLLTSVAWALLAFATMWVGIRLQDRDLSRSALLVLAFLTGKVMLFDLSGAAPVVRILCLVVLGITLYGAGWIYQQKLSASA